MVAEARGRQRPNSKQAKINNFLNCDVETVVWIQNKRTVGSSHIKIQITMLLAYGSTMKDAYKTKIAKTQHTLSF